MENALPPAEELVVLDHELGLLEARRAQLLIRRAWLLSVVRQAPPAAPRGPLAPYAGAFGAAQVPRAPQDASPRGAQNVLLALGGVLLTVAAIAFTLVSWGHLGIGGRSAVLGAVTALALAAPALLLRRGLVSTAESVAALGLALTVLDAYALHRVALPGTDPLGYAAIGSAALAALWAAYGLGLGRLRIPLPAALITAQLPIVLWALAAGPGPLSFAWALAATAAIDVAVALWGAGRAVRPLAYAGAWLTGAGALLGAGVLSVAAGGPADALRPGVLLVAVGALALFAALRAPAPHAVAPSAAAGLAALAAVGGVARPAVPDAWAVPVYVLCAVALLAVVRVSLPRPVTAGLAGASGAVLAAGALWALPPVAIGLLGPAAQAERVWSGAPAGVREALFPGLSRPWTAAVPLVLLTVAAVSVAAAAVARRRAASGRTWHAPAACAALVLAWAAAHTVPAVLDFGYPAAVTLHLFLTAASLAPAVRPALAGTATAPPAPRTPLALTALACALASALSVSLLSLAAQTATLTVLGVLTALFGTAAVTAAPSGGAVMPAACAAAAVVYATGLTGAAAAALTLAPHQAAWAVLAVPAATAALAARVRGHATALPLEVAGAAAALLATGLAAGHAPALASVLALCGVIAAGTAVRADRRPVGYAALVLFVLAGWVRLAASDVAVPEAYTLPVTVAALAVGALRRRRDPRASSWTAYGPGLAATLLPSLVAAWGDEHWLRPLLLGAAALAVTLTGAGRRLQALLVLGSAVLALDALHELAPYVAQVVGVLPRWLPPALAGLLLLTVGATYEQRLRDARRLRDTLGRMR
ncbi:SCO7613 C-terminal domain-containing membrane protein [Streptomyces sp. NPDC003016]